MSKTKCNTCDRDFGVDVTSFETHLKNAHGKALFMECNTCHKTFRGVIEFDTHFEMEHGVPLRSMTLQLEEQKRNLRRMSGEKS